MFKRTMTQRNHAERWAGSKSQEKSPTTSQVWTRKTTAALPPTTQIPWQQVLKTRTSMTDAPAAPGNLDTASVRRCLPHVATPHCLLVPLVTCLMCWWNRRHTRFWLQGIHSGKFWPQRHRRVTQEGKAEVLNEPIYSLCHTTSISRFPYFWSLPPLLSATANTHS